MDTVTNPVMFRTHIEPRIKKEENRIRYEAPFPEYAPFFIYADQFYKNDWSNALHYHNYFELTYVAEGSASFLLNEMTYTASKCDIFFTKPMEAHCGRITGTTPLTIYSIGFSFEQLFELEIPYYRIGNNRVVNDKNGHFRTVFERIISELNNPKNYTSTIAKILFVELLVSSLRYYESDSGIQISDEITSINNVVKNVLEFIHEKRMNRLTSQLVAEHLNYSLSHINREFKNSMGVSLGEYIRKIRLNMAKYYLKNNIDTISSIATRLDFDSVQSFSMFFKRQTGLYPNEYRQRNDFQNLK
jgi:AraC-like DNA-binding protein